MVDNYSRRNATYNAYHDWLFEELNKNIDNWIVGNEVGKGIGIFNIMHLLHQMRNENYASARPSAAMMDCLKKKAFCAGLDITVMSSIWPSSYNDNCPDYNCGDEEEEDDNNFVNDGVDFMQLDKDSTTHSINRIKNK